MRQAKSGWLLIVAGIICSVPPALAQQPPQQRPQQQKSTQPQSEQDLVAIAARFNQLRKAGNYAAAAAEGEKLEIGIRNVLGTGHAQYAVALNNLAVVYEEAAKYDKAEALHRRVIAIYEKNKDQNNVATSLNNLANILMAQSKMQEAMTLYQRAIATLEKAFGANNMALATPLDNLAIAHRKLGQYSEAVALHQRALAIYEKTKGASHADVAGSLTVLGIALRLQGKLDQAEGVLRRALVINEKALGPHHPKVAATLNALGDLCRNQEKFAEAEQFLQRSLAIRTKMLGAQHPDVAEDMASLARVYDMQNKRDKTEELYKSALAVYEMAFGADHPRVAGVMLRLATIYHLARKFDEAEKLYLRAATIQKNAVGPNHPEFAAVLHNLALLYGAQGDYETSLTVARVVSTSIINNADTSGSQIRQKDSSGSLVERPPIDFHTHMAALAKLAAAKPDSEVLYGQEGFEVAQWASASSAGGAIQQLGARSAGNNPVLAALVRESQDLGAAWRTGDAVLIAALAKPEKQRDKAAVETLRKHIADVEKKLAAIGARLEKEFPDYASFSKQKPLGVNEAKTLLADDEALVFYLASLDSTYVFALTRDGFSWHDVKLGARELVEKVSAFRRGLDVEDIGRATDKAALFDLQRSNELYRSLLGPVEKLVKDKRHLIVVASGALTALPFHLLVTEAPANASRSNGPQIAEFAPYRDAAWLLKRHAVTLVPSVASLKVLRSLATGPRASKPMIGFGDPVFGELPQPQGTSATPQFSAAKTTKVATNTRAFADFWTGAGVDRTKLAQSLPRLEDTADELKAVAKNLGAPASDILLRGAATEAAVKQAKLSDYRVVYFATHGLVAGDVKGLAEPSLALTLPQQASELDDGLLTASEVAQLKLNADWVVLSACNTIAGGAPGAEALSGLARSFFYAGARALLVSHWAVESDAATKLTTSTFSLLKADPKLGRAEAMRRAMLAYMTDTSNPRNAYPAFWGPFAVIGEGAVQ